MVVRLDEPLELLRRDELDPELELEPELESAFVT